MALLFMNARMCITIHIGFFTNTKIYVNGTSRTYCLTYVLVFITGFKLDIFKFMIPDRLSRKWIANNKHISFDVSNFQLIKQNDQVSV